MPHTILYNPELHIIELKHQGTITLNEVKEVILEVAQIAKEKGCFLSLGDYREATIAMSTMEIYNIPRINSEILAQFGFPAHKFKRAIVAPKNARDFHFFEDVTVNRGQRTKIFQDVDEAKNWLLDDQAD